MSDHLPECPSGQRKWQRAEAPMYGALCICRELRACEQRMLDDDVLAAAYHGQAGYAAGVQAARDAVLAYADERLVATKHPNMSEDITTALRVAAKRIDALKEKTDE